MVAGGDTGNMLLVEYYIRIQHILGPALAVFGISSGGPDTGTPRILHIIDMCNINFIGRVVCADTTARNAAPAHWN